MNNYHRHGNDVYSYETCILTRTDSNIVVVNRTWYSKTTGQHLRDAVRSVDFKEAIGGGKVVINLYDVPVGASADDLKALAKTKQVTEFGQAAANAARPNWLRVTASGKTEPLIAASSADDEELRAAL